MTRHLFLKKTAAVLISAAVTMQMCSCHERLEVDEKGNTELSISWWGGDDRNTRTLEGLQNFTEETGITVMPQYAEFSGFKSKMDVQMYSGTEADVMQLNYDWLYQYTNQGEEFYDIHSLDNVDLSTYPERSLECGTIDGKLQAIPYGFNAMTFIYNKTLLKSYGLDIPKTWDDLFNAAEILSKDGIYILSLTDKFFWMTACAYLEQTTGHKAFDDGGQLTLTEDDLELMLDFCKRLLDEKVSSLGSEYNRHDFSMSKMAGTVSWASDPGYFEDAAQELDIELSLGDYITTSEKYKSYGWYEKPTGLYAIRKDVKSPKDAGRLLNYLINSADMTASLGMSKGIPVSSAAEETLEARGMLKGVEYEASSMMKKEIRLGVMSPTMENSELINIFTDALESIYYGDSEPTEQAETVLKEMNNVKL